MKKKISSLAQLKEEKRKLKLKREVSKQLLFESLGQTRKTTTHLLTKKILVPTGVASVVAWGAGKWLVSNKKTNNVGFDSSSTNGTNGENSSHLWQELLPLATKLLATYLENTASDESS